MILLKYNEVQISAFCRILDLICVLCCVCSAATYRAN